MAFFAAAAAASQFLYGGLPHTVEGYLTIAAVGLVPLIFFVGFPMAQFKLQTRLLTIDDDGIETSIGTHHKLIPWREVAEIRVEDATLVIQAINLNSFIVPERAFNNDDHRKRFGEQAFAMLKANVGKS